ncbi:MAG TPA: transposase [Desulfobacteraceae bacterium]|nr:transposase [Desulfobacteraceae bacterium]
MFILHDIFKKIKKEFAHSRKGEERGTWFIYTLIAIIIPFTSSKTSNLLRCLKNLFGFAGIRKKRYYTFMASPKIPWQRLWRCLWKMIPEPLTNDRLILALDDYINPKTGRKIFGCAKIFDHAAKQNQSKYPWAQNIVAIGLLKIVKGRWACLPLSFRFYHLKKSIEKRKQAHIKPGIEFETKIEQAVTMIINIASAFSKKRIVVITDSWFGNNGLWKPLHKKLEQRFNMISRLRSNNNVFDLLALCTKRGPGRPRKYGKKLGNASSLAVRYKHLAKEYKVNLYGRNRSVVAYDRVVMLKTLKHAVKVVWVYRKTRWTALFSTDQTLSVQEIIEYYGARWKIEAAFKELKRDIGSADTQTRNPKAVMNHLQFCMMATSLVWIYASLLEKTPSRRHVVKGRNHFAFSDVRRSIAKAALNDNFSILCPVPRKSVVNSLVTILMRIAA